MNFDKNILREADIRGIYPDQLNGDFAKRLGVVFGSFIKERKKTEIIVGHDNRFGNKDLTDHLIEGLKSTGLTVYFIGLVTTPILNFASRAFGIEYGVMVTASHNPKHDNGFKLFGKDYQHLDHDDLSYIYINLCDIKFKAKRGTGSLERLSVNGKYYRYLNSLIKIKKELTVVVDAGNGTASTVVRDVFKYFDTLNVHYLFCDSDPNFPNHHPDPNVRANLVELGKYVKSVKADLGIAYDGDADRFGIVDDNGNVVDADIIIALMCEDMLKKNENKKVLLDVKSSNALRDEIKRCGGEIIEASASSAEEERVILYENVLFGGAYSNHIFFHDNHPGYDDGIYGSLRFIEFFQKQGKKLSNLPKKLNKYFNTPEIKVETTDDVKFKVIDSVKSYAKKNKYEYIEHDGIRVIFEDGWALLRASNTGPNLTLRFEATTSKRLEEIKSEFLSLIEEIEKNN